VSPLRACQCRKQTTPELLLHGYAHCRLPLQSASLPRHLARFPSATRSQATHHSMSSASHSSNTLTWPACTPIDCILVGSIPCLPSHWYGWRSISQPSRRLLSGSTLRQPCAPLNAYWLTATRRDPLLIAKWSVNKHQHQLSLKRSRPGVAPTQRTSAACFRGRIRGAGGGGKDHPPANRWRE
jgi:hypothetical protein